MRLERASAKAVRYAVMNYHYSKAVPMVLVAYAVFNGAGEWCGIIAYSSGANSHIATPYGLKQGQVAELVRVALNGKQESTSQALSISLRLLKKECPLVQLLVSYADPQQQHVGTIYQATNWIYTGKTVPKAAIIDPHSGKTIHSRSAVAKYGTTKGLTWAPYECRLKYLYPFNKAAKAIAETLRKPYPKKPASEAQMDERPDTIGEAGGSIPTHSLTLTPAT